MVTFIIFWMTLAATIMLVGNIIFKGIASALSALVTSCSKLFNVTMAAVIIYFGLKFVYNRTVKSGEGIDAAELSNAIASIIGIFMLVGGLVMLVIYIITFIIGLSLSLISMIPELIGLIGELFLKLSDLCESGFVASMNIVEKELQKG